MKFDIKLPLEVKSILYQLNEHGHEAYVVGGCVRDSILHRPIHDWDICTSATPEETIQVFKDQEVIPTGLQHGTVTLVINHIPFEITTFRTDGDYSDHRRPDSVKFTTDIVEDLSRRDFTINAMAYHPGIGLLDPFNGMADIERETIRCVGDAKERFEEDALRMLRAIRFAVQLDFNIHPLTNDAIKSLYTNLQYISVERVMSELNKMVVCPSFFLELLQKKYLFAYIIPELAECIEFDQQTPYHCYDVYNHISHAVGYGRSDLVEKLALLFHDVGKPKCQVFDENRIAHYYGHAKISAELADSRMRALKYDNDTRKKVVELISYHDATLEDTPKHIKRWLNKLGEEQFRRLLYIRMADVFAQSDLNRMERLNKLERIIQGINEVLTSEQCFQLKDLAVNGNDLISAGIKPGKKLGEILNQLLDMVINGEIENEKDKLLNYIKEKNICTNGRA